MTLVWVVIAFTIFAIVFIISAPPCRAYSAEITSEIPFQIVHYMKSNIVEIQAPASNLFARKVCLMPGL